MKSASLVAIAALTLPSSYAFRAPRADHPNNPFQAVRSALLPTENIAPIASESPLLKQINSSITATVAAVMILATAPANAVSGGGLDYAGLDISNQDYSNGNYKGKDFTQVIAKATTFANSNLQGCRFYKAYLVSILLVGLTRCCIHFDVHKGIIFIDFSSRCF